MGTRIALPVLSYDVPALQAWLEDRAAKGDYLSEYTVFPVFDRGEPRQVRYRLEPLARRKEREPRRRRGYGRRRPWQRPESGRAELLKTVS